MKTNAYQIRRLLSIVMIFMFAAVMARAEVFAAGGGASDTPDLPVGGWSPPEAVELTDDIEIEDPSEGTLQKRDIFSTKGGSVFEDGVSDIGYKALTTNDERNYYNLIDQKAKAFMNAASDLRYSSGDYYVAELKFTSYGISNYEDALKVFCAYDYDHPAYYWIANRIRYNSTSIYMLTEKEYAKVSDRARINELVTNGVKEYAALADKGTDTLDKISIVHDKMISEVDYAYNKSGSPETSKWAHSVHGVFDPSYSSVVCEGYADAFSLIMNYMGIKNYYIVGTAQGSSGVGGHAWNAVSDDNGRTYMYMDLTWDDDGEDTGYEYLYFGMPKTNFETRHFADKPTNTGFEWLYALPDNFNDSLEGSYYYKGDYYYDGTGSVSASDFAKTINTRAARAGDCVSVLSPDADNLRTVMRQLVTGSYDRYSGVYNDTTYYFSMKKIAASEINLSGATVTLEKSEYEYTGSAIEPKVKVVLNGVTLFDDYNYSVSYSGNTEPGEAKVTVTGKGNFTGSVTAGFTITDPWAHDHVWSTPQYTWSNDNSKCTASRSCSVENCRLKTETETVETTNKITKEPTCTAAGERTYTATFTNSAFGVKTKTESVAAAHKYQDVVTAPTCTERGYTTHTCTACGANYTDGYTAALGHSLTAHAAVAATCTSGGNSAYWSCSRCRKYFSDANGSTEIGNNSWVISALGHIMTEHTAVAATCTTAGNNAYWSCSRCNKYFSDKDGKTAINNNSWVISALGHDYGSWTKLDDEKHQRVCSRDPAHKEEANHSWNNGTVTTQPTCTEKGIRTYTCSVCRATKTEEVAARGHNLTSHVAVAATCTSGGNSAYWSCSRCNKYFSDANGSTEIGNNSWVTSALGHDLKEHSAVAATCTAAGNSAYWSCSRCNKYFADKNGNTTINNNSWVISALGHDYGSWTKLDDEKHQRVCSRDTAHTEVANHSWNNGTVTTQPTCTEKGVRTYTCSVCRATKTEDVAALGHTLTAHAAVAATCTTGGSSAYWSCSRCNKYFSDKDGKSEISQNSWVTSALGHELIEHKAVAATCTSGGNSAYWSCSRCNTFFSDKDGKTEIGQNSWVISETGHSWDKGAVTTEPTCTVKGIKTFTCSSCGGTYTEDVAALGHSYENVITDPTCLTQGYTTHTCTRCGDSFVDSYTNATGHDWGDWTEVEASSCTQSGQQMRVCKNDPEHVEYKYKELSNHDLEKIEAFAPTCTEAGCTEYWKCKVCGQLFEDENALITTTEADLAEPATGHKEIIMPAVGATCTGKGLTEGTKCEICGEVLHEQHVIAAKGHNYGAWQTTTPATEDRDGVSSCKCSACGATMTKSINMLPASIKIKTKALKPKAAKGSITVKWKAVSKKKQKKISGYQIQYATSSDFSDAKYVKVGKKKKSKKIGKLAKGTTYYVRVRTYKGNARGSWSDVKTVKTK